MHVMVCHGMIRCMPHAGINEHVNFRNFPNAILVLLRVATGDNWWVTGAMHITTYHCACESQFARSAATYACVHVCLTLAVCVCVCRSNIFLDCIPQQDCESTDGHTCGTWAAIPYFLTFIIMVRSYTHTHVRALICL